uniref:Mediator of RNA polymerase II transcription subunit 28 n=2 Tax=Canis lupus familiaris TaxID=9615 RepID=A0A8I3MD56_CANLF
MAAPLGGMFSGQPPGHAGDSRGQASLLQAAPGPPRASNSTLVDELESSFEACFASLVSQDYVNGTDQEEIRTVYPEISGYCKTDGMFFPTKKIAVICPETRTSYQRELRNELQRKDALVQKHLTKLRHWQQVLEDINVQHKKPAEIPQGSLAYLEQASANIPAPMKQT